MVMAAAPLLSIVTITKDNPAGLSRTGRSLNDQTSHEFEWLVIDGGAPHDPRGEFGSLSPHLIQEPDRGLYDAMNKGLRKAAGDYILFLNAGDAVAEPGTLEALLSVLKAEQPDFLYGDALEAGHYKRARSHRKARWGQFTHHQSMVYGRRALGHLTYDPGYRIAADYKFTLQALSRARNIHYWPAAICDFEPGGVSQRSARSGRQEERAIRRELRLCGPGGEALITGRHWLGAWLRVLSPSLYRRLRA